MDLDPEVKRLVVPLLLGLAGTAALFVARSAFFRLLKRWADRTETAVDDIVVDSVRAPSVLWVLALGLYGGLAASDLPEKQFGLLTRAIHVLLIFSATQALAVFAGRIFQDYVRRTDLPIPTTGLAYGILKSVIYIIGLLIILGVLGISIAPLLTALGVGGLAVALALQDTLANLFAGIHILVEKTIRVGDFVRLESGQEGYVHDIGWRTTRVQMLPNNMVIIPNSKLAQSVVTNYDLPERQSMMQLQVGAGYDADPERVEEVLRDEARKAVGEVPGLLASPEPQVRFVPGFGESSQDFTVVCAVADTPSIPAVQGALRKRIVRRFRQEGIEIPYPHRVVLMREEKR